MWSALGGVAVALLLIVFAAGMGRADGWARRNGLAWAMRGTRSYAVATMRIIRLIAAGFALYCVILFFERI